MNSHDPAASNKIWDLYIKDEQRIVDLIRKIIGPVLNDLSMIPRFPLRSNAQRVIIDASEKVIYISLDGLFDKRNGQAMACNSFIENPPYFGQVEALVASLLRIGGGWKTETEIYSGYFAN